jgi:dolichol-phosphate mannosyltransferase
MLSLVIPTYNERENICKIIDRIQEEFRINKIIGEIIVVDDNSPDGTGSVLEEIKKKNKNLQVIHRKGKLGLSSAVIEGWKIARGDILGVMDADLSHPVEKIRNLYYAIEKEKFEIAIGSRYIKGGRILGWKFHRKLFSKGSTFLAKVFTKVKDPMSGFFFIRKDKLNLNELNPQGFKILLEVLVKTKSKKIKEIPIIFTNRVEGKSKASFKEVIYYLRNLAGYLKYKKGLVEFSKFAVVGGLGTIVNLLVLFSFTEIAKVYYLYSAVIAFFIAMTFNYLLNKVWTFEEHITHRPFNKYLKFTLVSIFALCFNLSLLYFFTEYLQVFYLVSQVFAIAFALIINYIGNKKWTFVR